jgi:hypothetical protein
MVNGKASKIIYIPPAVINGHEEGNSAEGEGWDMNVLRKVKTR